MNRMTMVHMDTLSCEPILRRMENGEMLCVSQCGDVREPAPGNRVYVFHSSDEGETWSAPVLIRPEDGQAVYLTEVACFPGGRVVVYLTLHNGSFLNWVSECVESTDNGYTWRSIGPLKGEETFTFPRGVIRLRDGRYMMPCQHYPITPEENERLLRADVLCVKADIDRVENHILVSNDEGRTWDVIGQVDLPLRGANGRCWLWSEPTILELSDGRIAMLLRMGDIGQLYYAESRDGGVTFTQPAPTDIPNPSNKPKLLRVPDGRIALIHTPNPVQGMKGRNPLAVWLSEDEMASFTDRRIISDFPGAFCYPDGFIEGNRLLFTIEYNRHDILFVETDLSK